MLIIDRSCFLMGFKRQLDSMRSEDRWQTSLVFVCSMFATLFCALQLESILLVFLFVIIQIASYVWYMASYIPFGRQFLSNAAKGFFSSNWFQLQLYTNLLTNLLTNTLLLQTYFFNNNLLTYYKNIQMNNTLSFMQLKKGE